MKLFHNENGKEVVYVQMQDIMFLIHETDISIPASIFTKTCENVIIVNDSNRFDFVSFDNENEVKFFKELDFIIDYNEYQDLNKKQLYGKLEEIMNKSDEIVGKWNAMTYEEKKENKDLLTEYHRLNYRLNFIIEIYDMKRGKRTMPFPEFVKKPKKFNWKEFFGK